eukprot:COSAG01_NODE_7295_length_3263_cov_52.142857_2_plen_114_part_00
MNPFGASAVSTIEDLSDPITAEAFNTSLVPFKVLPSMVGYPQNCGKLSTPCPKLAAVTHLLRGSKTPVPRFVLCVAARGASVVSCTNVDLDGPQRIATVTVTWLPSVECLEPA